MLLIAAALAEELQVVLDLCPSNGRLAIQGIRGWKATRGSLPLVALKTGMGPTRAANSLMLFLSAERPARILVLGYGGALDPSLQLGDLIIGERASLLVEEKGSGSVRFLSVAGTWQLADSREIHSTSTLAGLPARQGAILTSGFIIGGGEQKLLLREEFHASIVDMETAALAQVAAQFDVPMACVRAVSDRVHDEFLAPFSYDPSLSLAGRATRILVAGNWVRRYGQWRENTTAARHSLRRFLASYLAIDD
jgi:adenosylhomocysteine nucleosidase